MTARRALPTILAIIATIVTLALCLSAEAQTPPKKNPDRDAYFGETHVHTSWSLDSYLAFGNTLAGPEEFYKYSLGQPITARATWSAREGIEEITPSPFSE